MSPSSPASFAVLLFPEDLPATAGISIPVYGTATTRPGRDATVMLLSSLNVRLQIPNDIVRNRQVDGAEHGHGAPGEWLRKAVVGVSASTYVLGQLVAYSRDTATIRTLLGDVQSNVNDLREVSPMHCFLFGKHEVNQDELSVEDLDDNLKTWMTTSRPG
ncbi:hypothetical protein L917_02873 [Phytophthora nicotianae]|uniref:Uncharacterized protein n=1 Tax=Phytophthora nicotianae TaxID=4792 RepID=W2LUK9_PHYNI|nr:hypothetical protein L917_02873 [Phytophthora nicotianae]